MNKYIEVSQLWKCETCFYYQNGKCSPNVWCESYESYRPAYSALRFADVAPVVHGEWIIKTDYKTPVSHAYIRKEKLYICPYCGKDYRKHMNFCGNCGAKMDGGTNDAK